MPEGSAKDWRIVAAVSLVQNAMKRLKLIESKLKIIGTSWETEGFITLPNQWEMILTIGDAGIEGIWFVDTLNDLAEHLDSENPHVKMTRRLLTRCLASGKRCLRKYASLWGGIMRQAIVESFKQGSLSDAKAFPIQIEDKRKIIETEGVWRD